MLWQEAFWLLSFFSHLTEGQRKTQMTKSAKAALLLLVSTAMGFAETPATARRMVGLPSDK